MLYLNLINGEEENEHNKIEPIQMLYLNNLVKAFLSM
ncbi:MAG: Unknown protein [uncultured Sulfurovum sp.]|uniref:Uncharacterized protein n=1 Tax=uncultured Sulfurovum sp. TaxID=269237 RepID=A0A6S6TBE6_9BACT|nr:MAG: Unknown protein [uncultured Sulfurovum sp.]